MRQGEQTCHGTVLVLDNSGPPVRCVKQAARGSATRQAVQSSISGHGRRPPLQHIMDTKAEILARNDTQFMARVAPTEVTYLNTTPVSIGKHNFHALVDTGASVNCISSQAFKQLSSDLYRQLPNVTFQIQGISDKLQTPERQVSITCMLSNRIKYTGSFVVLDHNHLSMILGVPFLTAAKAVLDYNLCKMHIGKETLPMGPPPQRSTLVQLVTRQLLPAYTTSVVQAKLRRPCVTGLMCMDAYRALTAKFPGLKIDSGILASDIFYCAITNTTDTPIYLRNGTPIGIARTVVPPSVLTVDTPHLGSQTWSVGNDDYALEGASLETDGKTLRTECYDSVPNMDRTGEPLRPSDFHISSNLNDSQREMLQKLLMANADVFLQV